MHDTDSGGQTVAIAGAGGNIGSHLRTHIVRSGEVDRVVVVDNQRYEEKNLASQDISARDVGEWKAVVQARGMKSIRPDLEVEALCRDLSDVPLGMLRCDLLLTALDSASARQEANRIAFHLGIPWWVDSGLDTESKVVRVTVYRIAENEPCLECPWGEDHYASMARASCSDAVEPTNGISSLGALAASLQSLEALRILSSDDPAPAGWELVMDARSHTQCTGASRRNPNCLFDHKLWDIQPFGRSPEETALGDLLADGSVLSAAHKQFATVLQCTKYGEVTPALRVSGRAQGDLCDCGGNRVETGFGLTERISARSVPAEAMDLRLSDMGFLPHDVFTVLNTDGKETIYELDGEVQAWTKY